MAGLEGGTLVPHRSSEEAFTFGDLPILKDELCRFKHYDTLLGEVVFFIDENCPHFLSPLYTSNNCVNKIPVFY